MEDRDRAGWAPVLQGVTHLTHHRSPNLPQLVGTGGCTIYRDSGWNLGVLLAPYSPGTASYRVLGHRFLSISLAWARSPHPCGAQASFPPIRFPLTLVPQ